MFSIANYRKFLFGSKIKRIIDFCKPNPREGSYQHYLAAVEIMLQSLHYSMNLIQDEARQLVQKGVVSRNQPIYVLCNYIPAREWAHIECELERCDFLLRDRIGDLLGREDWEND